MPICFWRVTEGLDGRHPFRSRQSQRVSEQGEFSGGDGVLVGTQVGMV